MLRNASSRASISSWFSSNCRHALSRQTRSQNTKATGPPIRYLKQPLIHLYESNYKRQSLLPNPRYRFVNGKVKQTKPGNKPARPIATAKSHAPAQSQNGTEGLESTIYALASAPGKAGIAVIKVSGPACLQVSLSQPIWIFGKSLMRSLDIQ